MGREAGCKLMGRQGGGVEWRWKTSGRRRSARNNPAGCRGVPRPPTSREAVKALLPLRRVRRATFCALLRAWHTVAFSYSCERARRLAVAQRVEVRVGERAHRAENGHRIAAALSPEAARGPRGARDQAASGESNRTGAPADPYKRAHEESPGEGLAHGRRSAIGAWAGGNGHNTRDQQSTTSRWLA